MALKDYALIEATADNNLSKVKKLLDEGANPNTLGDYGWTALHEACSHSNIKTEIIDALIDAGADPNLHASGGISALQLAVQKDNLDAVKKIVDAHADIEYMNGGKKSVLYYSAFSKNNDICRYIIDKLPNAGAFNKDGDTALHLLLKEDKEDAIYNLVTGGFDVNLKNSAGETARSMAKKLSSEIPLYKGEIALLKAINDRARYSSKHFSDSKKSGPKFF